MPLTFEDKFQYWFTYAQNDLDSAEIMLQSGRWFYTVFMCQQAIEKLIKGLYILYIDDNVPRLHDINNILDRFKYNLPTQVTDDLLKLFDTLSQFYLRSRYPDYTSILASHIKGDEAKSIFEKTREAYQWLLTMKP